MNNKLKMFLLLWPVALIAVFLGYYSYERSQIDKQMDDAHGFLWQEGDDKLIVHVNQREEGELLYIELEVMGEAESRLFHAEEVIDRDMFGGGFVKLMQADNDADKEIVVWRRNNSSYFLDFTGGNVIQSSFEMSTPEAKELAHQWHQLNVMASLEIFLMVLFAFAYYLLMGCIVGIVWLARRFKKNRQSAQAT